MRAITEFIRGRVTRCLIAAIAILNERKEVEEAGESTASIRAERQLAEEALRLSEGRQAAVMENLTEGLIISDDKGDVFYWNPAALAMFGYASLEECIRKLPEFADTFEVRTLDDDRPLPVADWPMSRVTRGEALRDWEVRLRRPDQGWEKILAYSGCLIRSVGGEILTLISTSDITERKRTEEALRRQEALLSAMVDSSPVGIAMVSAEGAVLRVNDAVGQMWGGSMVLARSIDEYSAYKGWLPDSGEALRPEDWPPARVLQTGRTVSDQVIDIERFDGTRGTLLIDGVPLRDQHGRVTGAVIVSQDITDRKRAEEALRESQQQLQAIIDGAPDTIVFLKDTEGRFITVNKRFEQMLGVTRDEVRGKTDYDLMTRDRAEYYRAHDRQTLSTGQPMQS